MRILFPCKIPLQTVRKPFHTSLPSFVRLHQFPSATDANIIIYLFLELFTEITFWKILPFCNEKICLSSRNTFNQVNWKFLPAQSMLNGTHRKWEIFTRESFPGTVQDKKKVGCPLQGHVLEPFLSREVKIRPDQTIFQSFKSNIITKNVCYQAGHDSFPQPLWQHPTLINFPRHANSRRGRKQPENSTSPWGAIFAKQVYRHLYSAGEREHSFTCYTVDTVERWFLRKSGKISFSFVLALLFVSSCAAEGQVLIRIAYFPSR